jgi:hypothetical protein
LLSVYRINQLVYGPHRLDGEPAFLLHSDRHNLVIVGDYLIALTNLCLQAGFGGNRGIGRSFLDGLNLCSLSQAFVVDQLRQRNNVVVQVADLRVAAFVASLLAFGMAFVVAAAVSPAVDTEQDSDDGKCAQDAAPDI